MLSPFRSITSLPAVPVYFALMLGQAVCFSLFFTVQLIYQVTVIGLDPLQMVLVGVVLESTTLLFEVPTGVVADVYSRRRSILIGITLIGCAYLLEGGIVAFWSALAGQVFWGLGYTFTSGATEAWITDEVGEDAVGPIFLRGRQMWLAGILIGTIACVALGSLHTQAPMVLAGLGMFGLALTLLAIMPERARPVVYGPAASPWARMRETARAGIRLAAARRVVRLLILISLVTGLGAEAWDRLAVPSAIARFTFPPLLAWEGPLVWFGLSSVIGTLLGLGAAELFRRTRPDTLSTGAPAMLLAGCAALQVTAILIYAVTGHLLLAFCMLWLRVMVSAISQPVETAWLNRHLEPATRATVLSITSQANSVGQVVGGPALGLVGSVVSLQAALVGSAVVLSPTIALYRRLRPRAATAGGLSVAD